MRELKELIHLNKDDKKAIGKKQKQIEKKYHIKLSVADEVAGKLTIQVHPSYGINNRKLHELVHTCLASTSYATYLVKIQN